MRRFVDLHTHSFQSDGTSTPSELIRLADQAKLAAIALTDHDTTAGLDEARKAAEQCPQLTFVPGVEISARTPSGTLHILGLGIDDSAEGLLGPLKTLRDARAQRNPKIVAKLQSLGVDLTMDDVRQTALAMRGGRESSVLGRMHIANALHRKGLIRAVQEAFQRYIGPGRPAFVDKECLTPAEAIAAIRAGGGIAVLAHPVHMGWRNHAELERVLREFKSAGLEGIEVYHSDHSPDDVRLFLRLARRLGLTVTGGSDFHGVGKPAVRLGRPRVPLSVVTSTPRGRTLLNRE